MQKMFLRPSSPAKLGGAMLMGVSVMSSISIYFLILIQATFVNSNRAATVTGQSVGRARVLRNGSGWSAQAY